MESNQDHENISNAGESLCTPRANGEEISNADLLSLMKTYMSSQISGLERNFNDTTQNLARKVRKSEASFKFKGNRVQYELNIDVLDNLEVVLDCIEKRRFAKASTLVQDSIEALKKRNKLIRIADKSEGGWKTVDEYLSDEVASDSEDEKRIRAAESRAVRKLKASKSVKNDSRKRPAEAAGSVNAVAHNGSYPKQPFRGAGVSGPRKVPENRPKPSDQCYNCGLFGHWANFCNKQPADRNATQRGSSK